VPPASRFVKGNFTNNGLRLPYFYLLPPQYSPARKYPLFVWLHGSPTDENMIVAPTAARSATRYLAEAPALKVFASAGREQADPAVILWPTRRAGDRLWTEEYLQLIAALLDRVCSDFSIDTNRIYLGAASEGVHAVWDLAAARPDFFAGALFLAGWSGRAPAESLKTLPVWVFHAATDAVIDVRHSRLLVQNLRVAGANPVYTEFNTGTHASSILAGIATPAAVDWLATQRRGKSSAPVAERVPSPLSQPDAR
jgi:predicted peptidase